jgi:hypothetical protein
MTDMIERVAKAINDAMLQHGDYKPDELARAAIAAMRDPTIKMMSARLEAQVQHTGFLPRVGWEAMIDAALECSTKLDEK